MKKDRGLKTRTVISNAIDTTLWEKLKDYSNETSIPLSRKIIGKLQKQDPIKYEIDGNTA